MKNSSNIHQSHFVFIPTFQNPLKHPPTPQFPSPIPQINHPVTRSPSHPVPPGTISLPAAPHSPLKSPSPSRNYLYRTISPFLARYPFSAPQFPLTIDQQLIS